jgi:hypothetical protein
MALTLFSSLGNVATYNSANSSIALAAKTAGKVRVANSAHDLKEAQYNIALENYELNQRLSAFRQNAVQTASLQKNQYAASGFDIASASAIDTVNYGLDVAARQIRAEKAANKIRAENLLYKAEVERVNQLNLAAAEKYAAQVRAKTARAGNLQFLGGLANQAYSWYTGEPEAPKAPNL